MSTPDFRKVRFVGPLSVFASEWGEHLLAVGYTPSSATVKLQLAADLSRWMDARRLSPSDLTGPVINEFVRVRRATHTQLISLEALAPMLDHLRSRGAVPALPVPAPESAEEVLLARYRHFLAVNRALTSPVIDAYSHWIGPFLTYLTANGCSVEQGELTGDVVAGFLTIRLETLSRKSAKMTASVVRSFLGFAHTSGLTSMSLAAAVPAVISRRLSGLPQPLSREQTAALLAVPDRDTPIGRRDYAVVLLLLRLGLRSAEVAALTLEDLDWANGTVVVHGKGGRTDTLPLPVDAGQALAEYLRDGRPTGVPFREVFVTVIAPLRGLGREGVTCIVGRLADKAGLGVVHAHRLRHTAASNVLNAGASMEEVAQLLRHTSVESTKIYAKTDMARLSSLARPWPAVRGLS